MSAEAAAELSAPELAILEALDENEPARMRRVDLAEAIEADYPEHELSLKQAGLIQDAGTSRVHADDVTTVHQLVKLTPRGESALAEARAPDPEPEPVEPKEIPRQRPWYETASWDEFSEAVTRILDETTAVAYDESADVVRIELERDGVHAEAELPLVAWHRNARVAFYDEYRAAFAEAPGIDDHEFGMLRALWIEAYADGQVGDE